MNGWDPDHIFMEPVPCVHHSSCEEVLRQVGGAPWQRVASGNIADLCIVGFEEVFDLWIVFACHNLIGFNDVSSHSSVG